MDMQEKKRNDVMKPYHLETGAGQQEQLLELVVPTTYGGDSVKLSLKYTLKPKDNFCNSVGLVEWVPLCYGIPREKVFMIPDDLVIQNLTSAYRYFQFVRKFLADHKAIPPTYEVWLTRQELA